MKFSPFSLSFSREFLLFCIIFWIGLTYQSNLLQSSSSPLMFLSNQSRQEQAVPNLRDPVSMPLIISRIFLIYLWEAMSVQIIFVSENHGMTRFDKFEIIASLQYGGRLEFIDIVSFGLAIGRQDNLLYIAIPKISLDDFFFSISHRWLKRFPSKVFLSRRTLTNTICLSLTCNALLQTSLLPYNQIQSPQYYIRQMITILPDQSYHLPVTDEILSSKQSHMEPSNSSQHFTKEVQLKGKKMLSWTNILLLLTTLFLIVGALYFYLPDTKSENNIKDTQTSLLDLSGLQESGKYIQNPNDGSSTGATQKQSAGKGRNDRAKKPSKPIGKLESDFRKTVIGDDEPPEDDESDDEEDPNKKKKKKLNEDLSLSDSDDQEEGLSEDELPSDEDDEALNWAMPVSNSLEIPPLVGTPHN